MQPKKRSFKIAGAVALSGTALALMAWISPSNYYQLMTDNDFIRSLKQKLGAYNEQMPEDRVYLQFDKPMYEPGDDIWFSAFVRDASTMKPSQKSDIVHVEFLNPKGTVEKSINIIAKNGVAAGDFNRDAEALGGMYKVRAYTNWMKNEGVDNVFEKQLQVQEVVLPNLKMKLDFEKKAFGAGDEVVAKLELNTNENKPLSNYKVRFVANLNGKQIVAKADATDENGLQYLKFELPKDLKTNDGLLNVMIDYNGSTESISRPIPIVLNKIKLQLFPEGGDLVSGLESKVAFRALNEFDKPADIEGIVVDGKGKKITSLSSFHMGMGAFTIVPEPNEKYSVQITKPENIAETFALPEALPRGYVMNVDATKNEVALNIGTTEEEELSLVAQVRNKVYYTTVIQAKKGVNKITFPTTNFPIGVSQITLFDSKSIERAERLAFVNKDKQLSISVETEKEKYLPREKVRMTISVKDERGMPMPATVSVAVVSDQFLAFADDKSGNILSQLLLQQDIKEKVEEPAFYFNNKEAKADMALDYLLMTAGWRHFTWEKVMDGNIPPVAYAPERAILSGVVLDANTGKAIPDVKIKIANGAEYAVDENGKFIFNKLDLTSPVTLTYSANGYRAQSQYIAGYSQNMVMYLYNNNYYKNASVTMAAPAVDMDMMVEDEAVLEMKADNVAPRAARREMAENKKAEAPVVLLRENNNKVVEKAQGALMQDLKVADKEVAFGEVADFRGFFNGKWKADAPGKDRIMANQQNRIAVQTYYRARTFAAPVYDKEQNVETRTDFRNTIYWNPDVEIDRTGKKTVEFYTSDDITSFRTTVEGLAGDGSIGRTEKNFFTQLPFAMTTKIPVEVATEDNVSIPLTLKNNTDKPLGGVLTILSPDGLQAVTDVPSVQTIMPGAAKTIYLDYKVLDKIGYGDFTLTFKSCGLGDAFTQKIRIAPKGFPVQASFS